MQFKHNTRFAVSVVLQVELHVDELLISAYTRIEAFRVSSVFNEAHFFYKAKSRLRYQRQRRAPAEYIRLLWHILCMPRSAHALCRAPRIPWRCLFQTPLCVLSCICFRERRFRRFLAILPSTTAMISISLLLSVFALRNAPSCSTVKLFSSG